VNIVTLGNEGSWYVNDLNRAAVARGHSHRRGDFRSILATVHSQTTLAGSNETDEPFELNKADAVIVRTMPPGSLEQVVFRMDCLLQLEVMGVTVFNPPRAIECAVDKFLSTSKLAAAGLPVPRTAVCESSEQALDAFHEFNGNVVVKPIFGAEGRGIMHVANEDEAFRVFRNFERLDAVLYLQEFISHAGYDLRVMVLDGEIIGSMKRMNPLDFRTNISRSGTAIPHQATEAERHWSITAAAAVGACFAGVDLIYDEHQTGYVLEVNAVPGWRAFQAVTGINVADKVIQSLEKTT